jgi:hypothetical protein
VPTEPPPTLPPPWDLVSELAEALAWCGGSADFAPGGVAAEGWARIVAPLLHRAGRALGAAEAAAALERTAGLEPATSGLGSRRSTNRAASADGKGGCPVVGTYHGRRCALLAGHPFGHHFTKTPGK